MVHAAPDVARARTPRQIQSEYESSLFRWLDFSISYSSVIAGRDLQAVQAVQKRARQTLERSFGAKTGDILAELDRIDRQARTGKPGPASPGPTSARACLTSARARSSSTNSTPTDRPRVTC
jgi:hypothetical protein